MAVPARESAAARDPARAGGEHDPEARGWADVRQALIDGARIVALAVTALARRPDDDEARELARQALANQDRWGEIARRWVVDEAVLAETERRAYDAGYAACRAARGRLGVIGGGAAGRA